VNPGDELPRYRVVLADDNQLIRNLLAQQLEELGHTVAGEAGDGAEVVEVVARERPDVAIIDLGLPIQDGLAATKAIADRAPTAVLLLSAYISTADPEADARLAGAHAFLAKPYLLEDLDEALEQAVSRFRRARKKPVEDQRIP
jgi:response regulator NasT